ncbi:MAG: hypothetical protein II755_01005 [Prevotella sp.]|nr:hypothetical protein [Prevotella sp.]
MGMFINKGKRAFQVSRCCRFGKSMAARMLSAEEIRQFPHYRVGAEL